MGESYGLWPDSPHFWELADPSRVCVLCEPFLTPSQPQASSSSESTGVSCCVFYPMYYRGEPQETPSTEGETEAQMSPMIEPKPSEDWGELKATPSWPLISCLGGAEKWGRSELKHILYHVFFMILRP